MIIGFGDLGHRLARFYPNGDGFYAAARCAADHHLLRACWDWLLRIPASKIQLAPFSLAVAVMCFILAMIIFLPQRISRFMPCWWGDSGMGLWRLCFPSMTLPGW